MLSKPLGNGVEVDVGRVKRHNLPILVGHGGCLRIGTTSESARGRSSGLTLAGGCFLGGKVGLLG